MKDLCCLFCLGTKVMKHSLHTALFSIVYREEKEKKHNTGFKLVILDCSLIRTLSIIVLYVILRACVSCY